jgi:hypothetical protein
VCPAILKDNDSTRLSDPHVVEIGDISRVVI